MQMNVMETTTNLNKFHRYPNPLKVLASLSEQSIALYAQAQQFPKGHKTSNHK